METFSRKSFWHYTSAYSAKLILNNQYFLTNHLKNVNDLNELKNQKNPELYHILCFCNTDSEKIPMWYLYSGINGDGVAIGYTPGLFKKWINQLEVYTLDDKKLENDEFEVKTDWIHYVKKGKSKTVKYRNKFSQFKGCPAYFKKDYPWEFENEFRIVIKTNEKYDRLILKLPDVILNKLKLKTAPEHNDFKFKDLKILQSELNIKMNLIHRNADSIILNIDKILTQDYILKNKDILNSKMKPIIKKMKELDIEI